MIRAIVKNGVIEPLEPLPAAWKDGREVEVREADDESELTEDDLDEWLRHANEIAAEMDPEDAIRLQKGIDDHRAEQKELMRRRMGLS